jgi:hypothetical protein
VDHRTAWPQAATNPCSGNACWTAHPGGRYTLLRLTGQRVGTRFAFGRAVEDHRSQAEHVRGKLTEELQTLTLLERELRNHPEQLLRINNIALAIGYLEQAIDALDLAGRK